jgi:thiol peroxidase
MAAITLEGNPVNTNGELPEVGSTAPDFTLTDGELNDRSLADFGNKKKVLNIVVSLDTGICEESARKFNQAAQGRDDVLMLTISADLPFAQGRVCGDLDKVTTLSMMRNKNFAKDYGVLLQDGPLAGLCSRSIVVLDENNKVLYSKLMPEIAQDPDVDAALAVL